jgi:hypothetical protein
MKKRSKKMSLSRETLRRLHNELLETAAGGVSTRPICCADTASCPPPPTGNGEYNTCAC